MSSSVVGRFILYHNPRCSKSRSALSLLEARNIKLDVIRYLDNPPSTSELQSLLKKLGMSARQLLRTGEDEYKALNLSDPKLSDASLIEAMTQHPKLIERPIFVDVVGERAVVGRPPENVLQLLEDEEDE